MSMLRRTAVLGLVLTTSFVLGGCAAPSTNNPDVSAVNTSTDGHDDFDGVISKCDHGNRIYLKPGGYGYAMAVAANDSTCASSGSGN